MPLLKEADLKKQIREKKFDRLYFLYGQEKYLIKHYTQLLTQKALGKGYSDFNFQTFPNGTSDIDAIAEAVEALPMMAERKCVVVYDLNVESLSAAGLKKLYELLEDLPDSTVLVIAQTTLEMDVKKSAKWKKFLAAAQKAGTTVELTKRGAAALEKQLISWAEKRGNGLSAFNAGRILQLCGDDLLILSNEMEKLCAYAKDREITLEDIQSVVTQNLETTVFVLSKALMAGDFDKAYQQLDLLFYQREEPVAVLAVLSSAYVDLYRVKAALESGEDPGNLSQSFDYKGKEFRLRNAQRDGKRLSMDTLRRSLRLLLEADVKLKSSRVDNRVILEQMIAQLKLVAEGGGR
ncbi:MAG: DNA polymerase III subunit delta [Clostridiales bacterium]|jgi:DNA polymerase-3 subunit delta|nr:DNA polymerase III subunit delta [Clostridiales bacterium]